MMVLAILFLFAHQAWAAEDWTPFAKGDDDVIFYDKGNVRKINQSSVIVWNISMPYDKQKQTLSGDFKSKLKARNKRDKIDNMKFMTQIDCVNRKYKPHYVAYFDKGNHILSSYYEYEAWQDIPPDSKMGILVNKVCGSGITPGTNRGVILSREQLNNTVNKISKKIPFIENEYTTATGIELMSDNVILWKHRLDKNDLINSFAKAKKMPVKELQQKIISEHGSVDKYFDRWKNTALGDNLLKIYCNEAPPRRLIDGGVIFKHAYYDKQGLLIQEIFADKYMCDEYENNRVERCLMFCETTLLDEAISFFKAHNFW
jgi:hypothetical protein